MTEQFTTQTLKISDLLDDVEKNVLEELFGTEVVNAVENGLIEKNNKTYLTCLVRRKEVLAKPEELVRQLWLQRLIEHYKYPLNRLAVEYPVTFGRDTSKRADIVVFDADRPTVPFLIVEVKQGKLKDGKEQLRSYTHATGAPLALWANGTQSVAWHRKNPNYFVEIPDIPAASQTIDDIAGQPWTIDTLIEIENRREAEGFGARNLRQLIEDMEDEVLANAGVDVFEEVFKLVFTKLYDEMYCYRGRHKYLRFRNSNTAAQLKAAIQSLFEDAKKQWPGVFSSDDKVKLSPEHLQVCVGSLEEWKLFNSNLDVVDEAFEYLVNKSSKGEKGQYFTPRWVIDMCVKMMNPTETETVIDTACGSAGFTVHSIFHTWKQILQDEGLPVSHLFTMEDKPQRCKDYVADKVFAIDFDEKSVRVARCLNLIAGDGQTNVLHMNTLDWTRWEERIKEDEDWQETYGLGWSKLKKLRSIKRDNRRFQFDVLMANPPFAGDIRQTDMLSPYEMGHKANGKIETAVGRDLLFIERNLDFLRPGGRMAIVLPQGRFNNASDKRIREFIADRCRLLAVVGLHINTFKPHTGTKTSVLFVQKWNDDENAGPLCPKVNDYNIFFATQQLASKDNSGDKIYVTERVFKLFSWTNDGEPDVQELDEEQFYSQFDSVEAAGLYQIQYANGKEGVESLTSINHKYGSLDALRKKKGYRVERIREAQLITRLLRDQHGHYVVQHDLFNHEGLTQDGIAEAFEQFAMKEKFSFF
ncbi:N-6 DNA methylase [Herbaspirillum rubrisubalbicans]|uniref:N-6 DNA methylase n=1 Tax=Herbaspirillum rubrisubalbicans TaxID=80842 RepID=UPI000DD4B236|nr:N-6 DNA methylase [Herbaspirillum rubrisubalbicans]